MTKQSKTIVFFGTDEFSLTSLRSLVDNNYRVAAVVTKPDSRSGRGHKLKTNAVKDYAISKQIEVWQPKRVSDINDEIRNLGDDLVGVLVVFGKIIPKSTKSATLLIK